MTAFVDSIVMHLVIWLLGFLVPAPKPQPSRVIEIPSRTKHRTIRVHVYESQCESGATPGPVLVNFNGSGFVFQAHGSDDLFCKQMADGAKHTVLDVRYRLAPQHPWPACHEDAEDVINWVREQPEQFDVGRISVSGFSSGGNIAAVVATSPFPKDTVQKLIMIYPFTDAVKNRADKVPPDTSGRNPPLWLSRVLRRAYFQRSDIDFKSPRVSPSYADPAVFPRQVLVITAARDVLCLEAEALGAKIADHGTSSVTVWRAEGCDHGWDKRAKPGSLDVKAKEHAYKLAKDLLTS